jgi:hypothetical protein
MKNIILISLLSLSSIANSQNLIGGKNILKTNLSSDVLNNYNITFERSLNHFMSVSLSYRKMNKQKLPLKALAKQYIENSAIDFDNFQIGNSAITAEARFYLGVSKMSGFYLSPYARMATFDLSIPIDYTYVPTATSANPTSTAQSINASLDGTIRSTSFGVYTGMQFQLLTKLVLDLWIIGGHYGTSNGKLIFVAPNGTSALALNELKEIIDQTKTAPFTLATTTTSNGVITDAAGPWAGIRGLGITLGFRF